MEQTLSVIDYAILLINGTDGVQSHTLTLQRLLLKNSIPTYYFVNKLDLATANFSFSFKKIQEDLNQNIFYLKNKESLFSIEYVEWLTNYDDKLLEDYLNETITNNQIISTTQALVKDCKISLVGCGSALKNNGIVDFLDVLSVTTSAVFSDETSFSGTVYKIMFDDKNTRITFLKCLNGNLKKKDEITVNKHVEKIHDIRLYSGNKFQSIEQAVSGDIVGVTGLVHSQIGKGVGNNGPDFNTTIIPLLKSAVILKKAPVNKVLSSLKQIEQQIPSLQVDYEPLIQQISVSIMGGIQIEILKHILENDFDLDIDFAKAKVIYKESIRSTVQGYGHFEPLRHYAEIHLQMTPSEKNGLSFSSLVSQDQLNIHAQNIVEASINSRIQKGILTGSPLTKIHFTLTFGAMHVEYNSKGDTREATWRAIRQGLEQSESILLEPWYKFEIIVPMEMIGLILSDIKHLHGTFDTPQVSSNNMAIIQGIGPVSSFMNYHEKLVASTKGLGTISLTFFDYLECHNSEEIISEIGYDKDRDIEYSSSSIFLSGSTGIEIKWEKVKDFLHFPPNNPL